MPALLASSSLSPLSSAFTSTYPASLFAPHHRKCHPERSDPIFSFAPLSGASGRAARFVRPVRRAGVEGSLRRLSLLCVSSAFSESVFTPTWSGRPLCSLCVEPGVIEQFSPRDPQSIACRLNPPGWESMGPMEPLEHRAFRWGRNHARRGRCRFAADARSSAPDPRAFPATVRASLRCEELRRAR